MEFGDNVDTDVIIPARYLNSSDPAELATHCMEDIDKDFIKNVKKGDIIVAAVSYTHLLWRGMKKGFSIGRDQLIGILRHIKMLCIMIDIHHLIPANGESLLHSSPQFFPERH